MGVVLSISEAAQTLVELEKNERDSREGRSLLVSLGRLCQLAALRSGPRRNSLPVEVKDSMWLEEEQVGREGKEVEAIHTW